MEIPQELVNMPGPQWLFGFDLDERQRTLFFRIYETFARELTTPLYRQSSIVLNRFLTLCSAAGLRLVIPNAAAMDVLRRPDVYSWATKAHAARPSSIGSQTYATIGRAHKVLARSRERLKRSSG